MTRLLADRVVKARQPTECVRCARLLPVGSQVAWCNGLTYCLRCILAHDEHHETEGS